LVLRIVVLVACFGFDLMEHDNLINAINIDINFIYVVYKPAKL